MTSPPPPPPPTQTALMQYICSTGSLINCNTNLNHQQQSQHNNHIYQAIQGNNNNHHSQHQYLPKDIITQSLTQQQHMESLPHDPIDVVQKATYNPDLNEVENPYYYAKNKLLHELHMERLKRCSL
uniref:Uncharacterized protein n=1 Tax=Glossina austeni TaxID=7395 RepID=A0A1A9USW2_GLOAU